MLRALHAPANYGRTDRVISRLTALRETTSSQSDTTLPVDRCPLSAALPPLCSRPSKSSDSRALPTGPGSSFRPGITVVVGPNGSGKSNIVDAIKWALGEQSVKSLRGQEMADVIFNGSGSRRAMNSAEITLSFDNTKRQLPVDAPEVQITRRVYRGGEGEYLINRSPARLRDIRDLLSGTGMGARPTA